MCTLNTHEPSPSATKPIIGQQQHGMPLPVRHLPHGTGGGRAKNESHCTCMHHLMHCLYTRHARPTRVLIHVQCTDAPWLSPGSRVNTHTKHQQASLSRQAQPASLPVLACRCRQCSSAQRPPSSLLPHTLAGQRPSEARSLFWVQHTVGHPQLGQAADGVLSVVWPSREDPTHLLAPSSAPAQVLPGERGPAGNTPHTS
jgi:hypothetical protein